MLKSANQQVTRSWFVGILEGEGCFRNTKKSGVETRISNTETDIINACESYLKSNQIWFTTSEGQRVGKRKEFTISIRNSNREIFQYATLLYKLIDQSLECRNDEFQSILGSSQTARNSSIDLDWMAGIYEAEGAFDLHLNHRGIANLKIELPNTNRKIIDKVEKNLAIMQCAWHIRDRIPKQINHSLAWSVEIYGMKRCERFLEAMNNRWVAERNVKRSSLMLQFIKARSSHSMKDAYTPEELQMIQAVCDLNSR